MRMLLALTVLMTLVGISRPCSALDRTNLQSVDAAWNSLRLAGDVQGLGQLLDPQWVLTHSDGRVQYRQDYLDDLARRTRTNSDIINEDVEYRLLGQTAVVTGTSVQSGISGGTPWSGRFRFTRTWVRQEGRWTLLASHSSRVVAAAP